MAEIFFIVQFEIAMILENEWVIILINTVKNTPYSIRHIW